MPVATALDYDLIRARLEQPVVWDCAWWGNRRRRSFSRTLDHPPGSELRFKADPALHGLPLPMRPVYEAEEDAEADALLESMPGVSSLGWQRIMPAGHWIVAGSSLRPHGGITTRELRARLPFQLTVPCPGPDVPRKAELTPESLEALCQRWDGGCYNPYCPYPTTEQNGTGRVPAEIERMSWAEAWECEKRRIVMTRELLDDLYFRVPPRARSRDLGLLIREVTRDQLRPSWLADCIDEHRVIDETQSDWAREHKCVIVTLTFNRIDGYRGEGQDYDGGANPLQVSQANDWIDDEDSASADSWRDSELARRNVRPWTVSVRNHEGGGCVDLPAGKMEVSKRLGSMRAHHLPGWRDYMERAAGISMTDDPDQAREMIAEAEELPRAWLLGEDDA